MEWLQRLTLGVFGALALLAGLALLSGLLIPVGMSIFTLVGTGNNALTISALAVVAVVGLAGVSWVHTHPPGQSVG